MKYQAVVFDLDGVLCHTDKYHYEAWKEIADELGIYFDEEINHRLRGVSRMESFDIILERYDGTMTQEEKNKWAGEKNTRYQILLKQMTPQEVQSEVRQVLETLKSNGIKLAIASSSKNAGMILDITDLRKYFEAISDGNNITNSKPHPEVFEKAAEYLGIVAENCLAVDDAVAGVASGRAAGMDTVAVGMSHCVPPANYYLKTFSDLLEITEVL